MFMGSKLAAVADRVNKNRIWLSLTLGSRPEAASIHFLMCLDTGNNHHFPLSLLTFYILVSLPPYLSSAGRFKSGTSTTSPGCPDVQHCVASIINRSQA